MLLFELSEFSLYRIEQDLAQIAREEGLEVPVHALLGSVQHRGRVQKILEAFAVQTVYHAAAYKHVPMVEHNVVEGLRNNVMGTRELALAAVEAGVERFVLVSTDKAVRPTNVMGASKRLAELVCQALATHQQRTRFCMVRFGNVCDRNRVEAAIRHYGVQTLYHAAAYKHVPIVENNVLEGVRNNVHGTRVVAESAARLGVERCVLISTDKAVRPTNVMGATKRMAELVLQDLASRYALKEGHRTIFSLVRFGNVLGSSGSVVPLFRRQLEQGGPLTVTHPEITRFFMTIPEAALLVIQAGSMAEGGDVFVLDMGDSVKIVDLARRMIQLTGLEVKDEENPEGDIEIAFSGLRPGEKLYEELLIGDSVVGTQHPKILRAHEEVLPHRELVVLLEELREAERSLDSSRACAALKRGVSGFAHSGDMVDLLPNGCGKGGQQVVEVSAARH